MLRTFDFLLIGSMAAAAAVTYQIKHDTDNKAAEVRRLEAEIKLEKDTIDLLRADRALLTQPNRLDRLVKTYATELQLQPTAPTQLARPSSCRCQRIRCRKRRLPKTRMRPPIRSRT